MDFSTISKEWGNLDLDKLKKEKVVVGEVNWMFELLGWKKGEHGRR